MINSSTKSWASIFGIAYRCDASMAAFFRYSAYRIAAQEINRKIASMHDCMGKPMHPDLFTPACTEAVISFAASDRPSFCSGPHREPRRLQRSLHPHLPAAACVQLPPAPLASRPRRGHRRMGHFRRRCHCAGGCAINLGEGQDPRRPDGIQGRISMKGHQGIMRGA